ncbi:purine/pyrimidine permease [Salirhabdus euzebyi]|nr:purine/pyrimidine permease [Salirhabdus euzebyi]
MESFHQTTLQTVQWFVFLLASSVALPIVIGSIYEMSFTDVSGLMQRTLFIVGIACFLQGWFGHRLPIADGPAGIWISTFTVYAVTATQHGETLGDTLRILETAMLLTGLFLIIMGVLKLSQKVIPIFTPLVTGAFLFMLTIQLSGTFLSGMLGLSGDNTVAQLDAAMISFFVFFFVLGFSIFWKGPLKNYGVLIGIAAGWVLDAIIRGNEQLNVTLPFFELPEIFAWGLPKWDIGTIPIAFLTAVILLSNIVASLGAANYAIKRDSTFRSEQMNRGSLTLGINQGISGLFSGVAVVTLASSSGFIELTGQKKKRPFMYASLLLVIIALFPPIVAFISMMPSPVANAALMATFVQLLGIGLNNIASQKLDQRRLTILGITFLIGIGIMFMPPETFEGFPSLIQNLVSNGLLMGTILVILLENLWRETTVEA